MEISRIQAYKPSVIDWKSLTAREIIKYKSTGVEVPNLYYQWAINFINDVENARNDDVTYQSAKAASRHSSQSVKNKEDEPVESSDNIDQTGDENSEDIEAEEASAFGSVTVLENPQTESEQQQQQEQKLNAKETREKMEQDGYSKWAVAREFRNISNDNAAASSESVDISQSAEQSSNDEISELESDMTSIMSQIDDIRDRINAIKNKKDDPTITSQIRRLNQQIKSLGINAQTQLAGYGKDFDDFNSLINAQTEIGDVSIDFGEETKSIGKTFLYWIFYPFGRSVIRAGENAVSKGSEANEASAQALNTNNSNISTTNSYKARIQITTGVGEVSLENENTKNDEKDPNQIDGKTKEADKDIKTAENDGSDTTDKLHLNIDEILKRKIRRGENT